MGCNISSHNSRVVASTQCVTTYPKHLKPNLKETASYSVHTANSAITIPVSCDDEALKLKGSRSVSTTIDQPPKKDITFFSGHILNMTCNSDLANSTKFQDILLPRTQTAEAATTKLMAGFKEEFKKSCGPNIRRESFMTEIGHGKKTPAINVDDVTTLSHSILPHDQFSLSTPELKAVSPNVVNKEDEEANENLDTPSLKSSLFKRQASQIKPLVQSSSNELMWSEVVENPSSKKVVPQVKSCASLQRNSPPKERDMNKKDQTETSQIIQGGKANVRKMFTQNLLHLVDIKKGGNNEKANDSSLDHIEEAERESPKFKNEVPQSFESKSFLSVPRSQKEIERKSKLELSAIGTVGPESGMLSPINNEGKYLSLKTIASLSFVTNPLGKSETFDNRTITDVENISREDLEKYSFIAEVKEIQYNENTSLAFI